MPWGGGLCTVGWRALYRGVEGSWGSDLVVAAAEVGPRDICETLSLATGIEQNKSALLIILSLTSRK